MQEGVLWPKIVLKLTNDIPTTLFGQELYNILYMSVNGKKNFKLIDYSNNTSKDFQIEIVISDR